MENFLNIDIENASLNREVIKQDDFKDTIKDWPRAKIVLTAIKKAFRNPIVKVIIDLVITAGEFIYKNKA